MNPYVGQIAIFGFNFAPAGWAFCQGQLLSIAQNAQLFSIIGNNYGGNGFSDFALPNLQGVPVGAGQSPGRSDYTLGQTGGEVAVTLTPQQMPSQSHAFNAMTDQATSASPEGNQLARAWQAQAQTDNVASFYSNNLGNAKTALAPNALVVNGSGRPHNNLQPYLTLNFCIALQGCRCRAEGHLRHRSRSSASCRSALSTIRRRAGRFARDSCCRSCRIGNCIRCSARPMAATVQGLSRCRICAAGCRSILVPTSISASQAARRRMAFTSRNAFAQPRAGGRCDIEQRRQHAVAGDGAGQVAWRGRAGQYAVYRRSLQYRGGKREPCRSIAW